MFYDVKHTRVKKKNNFYKITKFLNELKNMYNFPLGIYYTSHHR